MDELTDGMDTTDTVEQDQIEEPTEDNLDADLVAPDEGEVQEEAEESAGGAVTVTLSDGTTLTADEIEKGYLRQSDYSRKSADVAEERKTIVAERTNLAELHTALRASQDRLARFVQSIVPPEPDFNLSQTNPAAFIQARAKREQILAKLGDLLSAGEEIAEVGTKAQTADMAAIRATETANLLRARPELKDPARKAKFDSDVKSFALEMGFTEAQIDATVDAKLLQLVDLARIGKIAQTNRMNAARRKGIPAPVKGAAPMPAQGKTKTGLEAFNRLKRPTMNDINMIDF